MLDVSNSPWEQALAQKAEAYLRDAFGLSWSPEPHRPDNLPHFIGDKYALWRADLFGRPCILMALRPGSDAAVEEMVRHADLVRSRSGAGLVILLFEALTSARRHALIGRRVAFMVPMAQLFVPEALLDLRERASRPQRRDVELFSPTTQLVILGALLERPAQGASATALARRYGVAIMSLTRAFDELHAAGVADTSRQGQQRSLRLLLTGRELWEATAPRLQSPVRKIRTVVIPFPERFLGKVAGESALSLYTALARPRVRRLAAAAADWNQLVRDHGLRETERGDPAGDEVETWTYDPGALARDDVVDRLSLHLSLRHHPDERVAQAANELLEDFAWS